MSNPDKMKMTIVEFAEKIVGLQLYPYQKRLLEELEKAPLNARLISTPYGKIFFIKE